jgi:peptidoglycan/LPS O-acetylase OafA/YrhL
VSAAPSSADRDPHRDRMPCLDGLRGLAAIMVLLSHGSAFRVASFVAPTAGADGVLIFFGLSGFLMGDLYLVRPPRPDTVKRYIAARIARIAPIYYAVVIPSFLVGTLLLPDFIYRFPPLQFARLLTFCGSASVFWSISPEVQFYFLFVPLWLLHARLRNEAMFVLILIASAVFCVLTIAWWPGILVISKFHIFACGVLAAIARRRIAAGLSGPAVLVLHGVSLAVILALLLPGAADAVLRAPHLELGGDPTLAGFYGDPVRCLIAGLLAFSFSFESRPGRLLFANPLASLLGRCSFSIYLLHLPVGFCLAELGLLERAGPALGTLLFASLTVLVAAATYSLVEAPARDHVRRLLFGLMTIRRPASLLRRNAA